MSFLDISDLTTSSSLRQRITAAAASEAIASPDLWVTQNIWTFAAQPGWADAWASAKATYTADQNPDTGARPSVITDSMILSAVQTINAPVA